MRGRVVKSLNPRLRGLAFDSRSAGDVPWASFESTPSLSTQVERKLPMFELLQLHKIELHSPRGDETVKE